jgi:hypothetical protein
LPALLADFPLVLLVDLSRIMAGIVRQAYGGAQPGTRDYSRYSTLPTLPAPCLDG